MKNLFILLILVLSTNINAQKVPNLTTTFSDLTEDILLWEINEGDVLLYKYSMFYIKEPNQDIDSIESVFYVKLFFSEDRKKLISAITVIVVDDELYQSDYNITTQDVVLIDGRLSFTGINSDGLNSTIVLLPGKGDLISIYTGIDTDKGTLSIFSLGRDLISKVWYEDVIREASNGDWNYHYDFD
jgi:hypothetical protein